MREIGRCRSAVEGSQLVCGYFLERPPEPKPSEPRFGCFNFSPPNSKGELRIHFHNFEKNKIHGPLHITNLAKRRLELRQLFDHVAQNYPHTKTVRGTSWLYHTVAYCSLFPTEYVESKTVSGPRLSFQGNSSWGQFLDFKGEIKSEMSDLFQENLRKNIEYALMFPLPALSTESAFLVFRKHFEI